MSKAPYQKGRGAQMDPQNRFEARSYQTEDSFREHLHREGEDPAQPRKTRYLKVYPKSIVNRVNSPDIGRAWSMNPYQGCEHGCSYCYARNSHQYWGYSSGRDFEQTVLVKEKAAALLERTLQKPSWKPDPIMLSGNTDCYQPAEQQFQITRQMLKVLQKYRQPVGIITKNALIKRDIDLLAPMAREGLVHVALSVTTLDEKLRGRLEPRTAAIRQRLKTIKLLAQNEVPVQVMIAPVIPGLNSHEIMAIAKAVRAAGASAIEHTMVRLNDTLGPLFLDWVAHHYPDRLEKIKHGIEATHAGQLNDSQYGRRMKGEGPEAQAVKQTMALARKKYFEGVHMPPYNREAFLRVPKGQFNLFD